MSSLTEYLVQIQKLTNKNLEILKALNSAFYSNKHHVVAIVDDEKYIIPSFLTLENKLNTLQANFQNIVDAPSTGEAYMTFDGNTQKMQMMGYSQTPHSLTLDNNIVNFNVAPNDVFKDFITPETSVRLVIPSIDNCTKNISIKKISAKSEAFRTALENMLNGDTCKSVPYGDVNALLFNWEEDVDYTEYDTLRRLPLRSQTAFGTYIIQSLISHAVNDNFTELYTLKLDSVKYYTDSGTIEHTINVGDILVTNKDTGKLEVTAVRPITNEVDVRVMDNGFAELGDISTGIEDMYTLHYFRSFDFDSTKYIDVPLEEDRYVFIYAAPVNDTTNVSAFWGDGLLIDTYNLTFEKDGEIWKFGDYYDMYVNNLGDTLFGVTSMFKEIINNMSEGDFRSLQDFVPYIDSELLHVTQINKHLNDSESVKNIRRLYSQKSQYKQDLSTVQLEIDNVTTQLNSLDFDDTTNSRQLFVERLADLNERKSQLTNSISSLIAEISQNVNDADVPIENAKYHIRGFIEEPVANLPTTFKGIVKLDVEYRYKNRNRFTGNAETISKTDSQGGVTSYIYSDWNRMDGTINPKVTDWLNGNFTFDRKDNDNDQLNEIAWNQVDIPITQGEAVDIRARWIFDWCWPFAECRSNWSEIYTVEFPEEYLTNMSVVDIINENNDDANKEMFTGILNREGILKHVGDKVEDQDNLYFHQASHIASGFYTDERRIVPLFDKLKTMDDIIGELQNEVLGVTSDNLQVTLYDSEHQQLISPFADNVFNIMDYTTNINTNGSENPAGITDPLAYEQITVDLYNAGAFNLKLFTSFPGDPSQQLTSVSTGCNGMSADNYVNNGYDLCPYWKTGDTTAMTQRRNQWVYFRRYSVWDSSEAYYANPAPLQLAEISPEPHKISGRDGQAFINNSLNGWSISTVVPLNRAIMTAFPIDSNYSATSNSAYMSCCCPNGEKYITIAPGEHKQFLIGVWYGFNGTKESTSVKLSFDLRTSLFADPVNYEFTIAATRIPKLQSKTQRIQSQLLATKTQEPYRMVILSNPQQ